MEQIENFKIVSVGNAKDLSGTINGDFTILYRTVTPETTSSQQAFWLCQCNLCKNFFVKSKTFLNKENKQCDCRNNLVGKQFGRWTVLYLCEERTKKRGN